MDFLPPLPEGAPPVVVLCTVAVGALWRLVGRLLAERKAEREADRKVTRELAGAVHALALEVKGLTARRTHARRRERVERAA